MSAQRGARVAASAIGAVPGKSAVPAMIGVLAMSAMLAVLVIGVAVIVAAAPPPAFAAARATGFGPVRVASDGAVIWSAESVTVRPSVETSRAILSGSPAWADSARAWTLLAKDSVLQPFALRQLAPLLLAHGDTLGADSAWAALAAMRSLWTYEALRGRADIAMLRNEPERAEVILESADRESWPDLERVSWLVRRAELKSKLGDQSQAIDFAQQAIRRYPSLPPAVRALRNLEQWMKSTGQPLAAEDERVAAEIEAFRPDRSAAIVRLAQAARRLPRAARLEATLRRLELLRLERRFDEAYVALAAMARDDSGGVRAAAIALERARVFRDDGKPDSAFAVWRRAAMLARDDAQRETAWWELTREAEEARRWNLARESAARAARIGGRRSDDAALREGIHWLQAGQLDSALVAWDGVATDGASFWRAAALRASTRAGAAADGTFASRADADSILRTLARAPGYGFYRVAARESLGVSAWPRRVEPAARSLEHGVSLAGQMLALGATDDAFRTLDRWSLGDPRLEPPASYSTVPDARWRQLLAAARIAYGAGRWGTGIRYARLAFDAVPASDTLAAWGVLPWTYPPALDTLFTGGTSDWSAPWTPRGAPPPADSMRSRMPDRALVYAVMWQESKFDPLARSRSNALGLMQLKLGTALEQARLLRLPSFGEGALFVPRLNVALGSAYLGRLMRYFDNRTTIALAAYNAGPTAARRWAPMPPLGGEALACELIGYGQAHDYVKIILGVRQAVREMQPRRE